MNARSRKPSRFITCGTVGAILFVAGPRELSAQCEVQKLSASDAPGDAFGWAVSVGNDVAAVGAWGDDCGSGNHCGAAYVYRVYGSTWVEEQKLTASDAANGDDFGKSVSISDNVVLVGAPFGDCVIARDCGTAYVYRFNGSTWVQEKKLTASDAADNDWFGFSVCLSGDVAVVGAQSADCAAGAGCGAAYLYRFNSSEWVEEQKLTASDAAEVDFFGWSVSITRDVAVVGAPLDDCAAGAFCGAAYVYRFNGLAWIEEQKLIASDAGNNEFGRSVSASGNVAIVGAPDSGCAAGAFCGAAYVFRFNGSTWVEEQKLTASDANWSDLYGSQVSIIGNIAIVGAVAADCAVGPTCGAAYVYRFNGSMWVEERKLTASDTTVRHEFGASVSASDAFAFVGATGDKCAGDFVCGAAYVFALGPDCNANGEADFCDIHDGDSSDGDQDGIPDECETVTVPLDIRHGACPNPFNPKNRGVLPIVVVGTETFDVTEIDTASLLLLRPTSHGGRVRPLSDSPGHGPRSADTVTYLDAPPCDCPPQGPDGHDDLILKFSISEMVEALDLDAPAPGDSVMLTLTGVLNDGTPFAASDCILITGGRATPLPTDFADRPSDAAAVPSAHSNPDLTPTPVGRAKPKE